MLLKQRFKTWEGAHKRAAFENAHCDKRYHFFSVICNENGEPIDHRFPHHYDPSRKYTWRLEKRKRVVSK